MLYDLIIIGLGPAGLTASVYASRYKLNNLIVGEVLAGELSKAARIENIPGFISISGMEWGEKAKEQAEKLGAKLISGRVSRIEEKDKIFKVVVEGGEDYQAKSLIVATGSERRRLNIPGEKKYLGRGVSYCTTCDAAFFKNKTVALIGGSNAAVSGAIHAAEFARKVYIIYRKDELRAEPAWVEEWGRMEKKGRGETIYRTNIVQILGGQELAKLKAQNSRLKMEIKDLELKRDKVMAVELDRPYRKSKYLFLDGVFIEIGGVPGTALLKPLGVEMTERNYVKVNERMETNVKGLFCAGDITEKALILPQAITAMAQGALAASSAYQYLKKEKAPRILGV